MGWYNTGDMNNDFLALIVEVAVTVYVFLLGLPILANQIFMPDDLRRMSKKNYAARLIIHIIIQTVLLVAIVLVAYPQGILTDLGFDRQQLLSRELLNTGLFILMLALTLGYLYVNLIRSQGYRAKVVDVIRKKLIRNYRQTGDFDEAYLQDLEYLGIYSKAGAETRIVIRALEEIRNTLELQGKEGAPNHQLIKLIEILCNSVANSVESGSRHNMNEVLSIYKQLLMELSMQSTSENQLIYGNETRRIKECTTKIALMALKKDYSDMMPLVLNVLTLIPGSSDKLFDIGLLALGRDQYQIATNVLSEMMDRDNKDPLTMHNYLGLVAHFYACGGAARRYALHSLDINDIEMGEETLDKAVRYHYILSNFATVDKLEALRLVQPVPPAFQSD